MSKKFILIKMILMMALVIIIAGCGKDHKNPVGPIETNETSIDCWTPPVCGGLIVTKTAEGSCDRCLDWTITKTADPTSAEICVNDQQVINYTVTVTQVGNTDKCKVSGEITIKNTGRFATTIINVQDEILAKVGWYLRSVVKVTVKGGFTIPAFGTEVIPYEIEFVPPKGYTALKNTAYVLQKYGYSSKLYKYTIPFTLTQGNTNECVDVMDSYAGTLGQVCGEGASKTFTYSRTVSYGTPGTYTVENTATADGKSASATVTINVIQCGGGGGCTYTQGYWKNHEEDWPVTSLTLGTVSYTQAQLLSIFDESVDGNGLISLAHQLIAAKLNVANGADDADVAAAIVLADALIDGLVVPPIGSGELATSVTSELTDILDQYNKGEIGPGHCPN